MHQHCREKNVGSGSRAATSFPRRYTVRMTLENLLQMNANKHPHREAVAFGDIRFSFQELYERSAKRAQALLDLGIGKGDHVATLGHNSMQLVETFFGLWQIGAVVVPLNIRLSPGELEYILNQSDTNALIFLQDYQPIVQQVASTVDKIKRYLYVGESCPSAYIDFEKITELQKDSPSSSSVCEEDVATIVYTAGTTGKPKGVILTHRNWAWGTANILMATWSYSKRSPKVLSANPFFHVGGFINLFWSIFNGGSIFILKKFDPKGMLSRIEKERPERLQGPSTIYKMLLQTPNIRDYDLSSVRIIGSGAESMPHETRKQIQEIFPNAGIWEFYGMTEACGVITIRSDEDTHRKPFSVGLAHVFEELRVVDENDRDVPCGEIGEIIVRGPHVMAGYYKDPEKTAEAIHDGWFHTQDLGRFDEDGFLYVIERKHNMIISGGENIYPKEVEDVLFRHPKIADTAVFGIPDAIWGHRVCAVVVPKTGEHLTAEEVVEFCEQQVAGYKKPRSVFFVESLPRSSIGKVLRDKLKDQFAGK